MVTTESARAIFVSMEDRILFEIDLERQLSRLHPAEQEMLRLMFVLDHPPEDWEGSWPPTLQEIGHYIGCKYEGGPLSEAAMRYRRDVVKDFFAGNRGVLRRNQRRIDLNKENS